MFLLVLFCRRRCWHCAGHFIKNWQMQDALAAYLPKCRQFYVCVSGCVSVSCTLSDSILPASFQRKCKLASVAVVAASCTRFCLWHLRGQFFMVRQILKNQPKEAGPSLDCFSAIKKLIIIEKRFCCSCVEECIKNRDRNSLKDNSNV